MNAATPIPNAGATSLPGDDPVDALEAQVERLRDSGQRSTAEMLQELRRAFPHSPLAFRVRALALLQQQR
jgi:hypothetical protein